jgi:hypothetical protein
MDSHHAEYLAAASALHEQTPSRRVYAEGDFVSGKSGGKCWSGRIQQIQGDRLVVEASGAWLAVSVRDITH